MGEWENDRHVFIIGLWELESLTFCFAYFVVLCKAATDPLLVYLYLIPQMCGFSSSFLSFSLPSCECWFGQFIPNQDPAIVWIEIVIVSQLMWFLFFFPSLDVGTACAMCFMKSTAESFKLHPLVPCSFFLPPTLAVESAGEAENKFGTHMVESTD